MDKTNMARFAELMTFLAQNFSTTLGPIDIENYWRFLRIFPLNDVERAIINYCRNPQGHAFMPRPGEIIAYIEGSGASQAMQAWSKVVKAVKDIGAYSSVVFDDALIHAVVQDMGGWIKICHCPENELPYRAREFEKRYIAYLINKPIQYPEQLIGITDSKNTSCGFKTNPQILIGNEVSAYKVYKNGQQLNKLAQYKPLNQELIIHLEPLSDKEDEKLTSITNQNNSHD